MAAPPNCCLDTPRSLNSLIEFKFKAKRNEEKLNKVVKQVNCMLARTFADLNGLPCDENLALKMNEAYFDQQAEVFGQKVTYTQQSFSKLVACRKYRADFEAIMTCALVREFCDRRHAKVTQEVKRLRRKFLEGNYSAAQTELNKRSPGPYLIWLREFTYVKVSSRNSSNTKQPPLPAFFLNPTSTSLTNS